MMVKIDADITSLTKNLDKGQKLVMKAADAMGSLGNKMMLGITLPAIAAAGEFAKMAASAENSGARFSRVFGPMTDDMQAFLRSAQKNIPETIGDLEQLSSRVMTMTESMGLAPAASEKMSKGIISLAGDMAAFNKEGSIDNALATLEAGLAGQTRGLKEYGVVISKADVQTEAFKLGIMSSGEKQTSAGTAVATNALMLDRSTKIQGEAARTAKDASQQFQFMKVALEDTGERIGSIILPAVVALANGVLAMLKGFQALPSWLQEATVGFVALAAAAGPLLKIVSLLTKLSVLIAAAKTALGLGGAAVEGAEGGGFIAALLSPVGLAIAGIVTLTAVLYGAYKLWQQFQADELHFSQGGVLANVKRMATTGSFFDRSSASGSDPSLSAQALAQGMYKSLALSGKDLSGSSAFTQPEDGPTALIQKAQALAAAFDYAKERGDNLLAFYSRAVAMQTQLNNLAQHGNARERKAALDASRALNPVTDFGALSALGIVDQPKKIDNIAPGVFMGGLSSTTSMLTEAFSDALNGNGSVTDVLTRAVNAQDQLYKAIAAQGGDVNSVTTGANSMLDALSGIIGVANEHGIFSKVANPYTASSQSANGTSVSAAGYDAVTAAKAAAAKALPAYNNNLATSLAALKDVQDPFNAAGEAALRLGQALRAGVETFDTNWQELKQGFQDIRNGTVDIGGSLKTAANAAIDFAVQAANAIASRISGGGFFGGLGAASGGTLTSSVLGGLAGPIGAIGGALIGRGLDSIFGTGGPTSHAATALNGLATAANAVSASLSNAPSGFRVGQYEYAAEAPSATSGVVITGDVHLYGVTDINDMYNKLSDVAAEKSYRGGTQRLSAALSPAI